MEWTGQDRTAHTHNKSVWTPGNRGLGLVAQTSFFEPRGDPGIQRGGIAGRGRAGGRGGCRVASGGGFRQKRKEKKNRVNAASLFR